MMISLLLVSLLATSAARPHVGDAAPAFEARTLAGRSVRSDSLRGQVTVVEFFASWCEPCKESLSEILAIRESSGSHFGLMLVAVESDVPALKNFVAAHPLPAGTVVALDGEGVLARAFGEDRLPTTFFLDARMIIRHINRGHGAGFRERATRWLSTMPATSR
jgi:cytochrome c biogenesis protein CcmG/thiol:disulfide interchange protein DsbE